MAPLLHALAAPRLLAPAHGMKPTLSLVTDLPVSDLADVPALLRKLAGDIEAGKYGEVHAAAVVLEAPELPVFGFGATGHAQNASELHSMAHLKLTAQRLTYIESLKP